MPSESEPVRIRAGVPQDLPVLRGVFRRSSLSNEGDREYLLANPHAWELSYRGVAEGRTRVAVGVDGAILGFITSAALGPTAREVEDLFVDPPHMRRGIARRLMQDLVADARGAGVVRIEVTANPHAEAFYRSVGFVRTHTLSLEWGSASRMELVLGPDVAAGPRTRGV